LMVVWRPALRRAAGVRCEANRSEPAGLSDAGFEAVGLDERGDESANVVDSGAVHHIPQSFCAGLAGSHLEIHEMKFIAEVRVGVMQILPDPHKGLIKVPPGLDAITVRSRASGNAMRMRCCRSLIIRFRKKRGMKKPRAGTHTSSGRLSKPENATTPAKPRAASTRRDPK